MNVPRKPRRYVILAPGFFATRFAKVAHAVIAYARDEVVAVFDPALEGRLVGEVLPQLVHSKVPIVADLEAAFEYAPNALLIGVAPTDGRLPPEWRPTILMALRAGLEVVSGLHEQLADDPEFAEAAYYGGVPIWDVRSTSLARSFTGASWKCRPFVLLAIGNHHLTSTTTVALELVRAACERQRNPEFFATGHLGIVIAGKGVAIDRVMSDFATGAVESLVTQHQPESDLLIVEGQGAIHDAVHAPVALALLYGAAPDGLVFVHDSFPRDTEPVATAKLPYTLALKMHETLAALVKPAPVLGMVIDTHNLDEAKARQILASASKETGLPVDDIVRFGALPFYDAIAPRLMQKTLPVSQNIG